MEPLDPLPHSITSIEADSAMVTITVWGTPVTFTFNEITLQPHKMLTILKVTHDLPPAQDEAKLYKRSTLPHEAHLDVLSPSGVESYRRTLDQVYGKDVGWAALLSEAIARARAAYVSAPQAIDLDLVPVDFETRYRIDGLVAEDGVTIFFGMGSSAKTYVVLAMCHAITAGREFMGRSSQYSRVMYLDYEARAKVLRRRWHRLDQWEDTQRDEGFMSYMPARGIPVYEQIVTIRRELARTGAGVLVVDSAVAACGGDPSKPEFVSRMLNALNSLNVPVILIAHVTKEGGDEYPFGSIFWHNFARMTWNVKRVDSEDSPDIEVGLFNKKANDDRRQKSFGLKIGFDDPFGPVTIQDWDLRDSVELSKTLPASVRIKSTMFAEHDPITVERLHELLPDIPERTISNTLAALKRQGAVGLLYDATRKKKAEYELLSQ